MHNHSNTTPLISIITAVFNGEDTLEDTILSILNQTYDNYEFIIIDGGSTDKSVSIIEKYETSFNNRLIWISEKDTGIYDAWNKGVNLSKGEWISFVGSDDVLLPNALSLYKEEISNHPNCNYISSKITSVERDLKPIKDIGEPWSKKMHTYCCIAHVGSLHHKNLFIKKGLYNTDFKIAGDYDFLLRCKDIIKAGFLQETTALVREGGISRQNISKIANETLKAKLNNQCGSLFKIKLDSYISIWKFYFKEFYKKFKIN